MACATPYDLMAQKMLLLLLFWIWDEALWSPDLFSTSCAAGMHFGLMMMKHTGPSWFILRARPMKPSGSDRIGSMISTPVSSHEGVQEHKKLRVGIGSRTIFWSRNHRIYIQPEDMHRVGVGVSNDAYTYCTRTRYMCIYIAHTLAKPTQIAKYIHVYIYQVKYKTSTYATIPLCTPSNQPYGVYAGRGARRRDPPPRPSGQLRARWPKRQQAKQRSGSRQFANLWSLPRHLKHLPANVFL